MQRDVAALADAEVGTKGTAKRRKRHLERWGVHHRPKDPRDVNGPFRTLSDASGAAAQLPRSGRSLVELFDAFQRNTKSRPACQSVSPVGPQYHSDRHSIIWVHGNDDTGLRFFQYFDGIKER